MATTKKLVVLTTENELQVNEQSYGWLKRIGKRLYAFCQCVRKKNPMPEEKCQDLAQLPKQGRVIPGKIYANGYGVFVRLYVKHTEYNTTDQLVDTIMHRTADLCAQLKGTF